MKYLVALLTVILRGLLPALFKKAKDTAEDADPQTELRDRLRRQVRKTWFLIPIAFILFSGCVMRTVYVPHGTPVRLRETIPQAKVWVKDSQGEPVKGRIDLHEGWFCLAVEEAAESQRGSQDERRLHKQE